ncbi:MAG: hypothetical protein K9N51_04615 [Candidatus Pacebacteria bacterium]|nr:hypothetical protein [Candidatus Paceibacterota bacterium]
MSIDEFIALFETSGKRYHIVGNGNNGVLIGLDLEGRLFAFLDGEVLNKVHPQAVLGQSSGDVYLNPGGDGLWPAPEGSCLGYEYATGQWRVPPGITGARYGVQETNGNVATVRAEIDLINNIGVGIPTVFGRSVSIATENNAMRVTVIESIQYIGTNTLENSHCLLAPWTLCQFDSGPESEVVFPGEHEDCLRDLYDSSDSQRWIDNGMYHCKTDGAMRYQVGMDARVPWIEYRNPGKQLTVRRSAKPLPAGQGYIDIADSPPSEKPSDKGVSLSVYSDPGLFMEIEAAGGCPHILKPGARMTLEVETIYSTG